MAKAAKISERIIDAATETPVYQIVDDLPIPERRRGTKETMYPFASMNVGQAFKFKADEKELKRVNAAVNSYKKNHPSQFFAVRRIDENTYGCWRTAEKLK